MKNTRFATHLACLPLVALAVSCAGTSCPTHHRESRARMAGDVDRSAAHEVLLKSIDTYESIVRGPQGEVPRSVLTRARCVVVLPDVGTAAAVVGGTRGVGVTSCKEGAAWSPPAFVELNQASLGAQLGGKSADTVIFVMNDAGRDALQKGSYSFGADASVVAGTYDRSWDPQAHGAVAYSRTEGAFAGAAFNRGSISSDDDYNMAYYGREADYPSLLRNRTPVARTPEAQRFIMLLPS